MISKTFKCGTTIEFHPDEHVYCVVPEGRILTSVTSVWTLPPWAIPWSAKAVMGEVAEWLSEVQGIDLTEDEIRNFKKAPMRVRDAAGNIGSAVHTAIYHWHMGMFDKPIDPRPEVQRRLKSYIAWFHECDYEIAMLGGHKACEIMTYYKEGAFEYVGTCDLVLKHQKTGLLHAADVKSGSAIKKEGWMQCAAYRHAIANEYDIDPDQWGDELQLHSKLTKVVVKSSNTYEQNLRAFRAGLIYKHWKPQEQTIKPEPE